jgi:hypothetical protein
VYWRSRSNVWRCPVGQSLAVSQRDTPEEAGQMGRLGQAGHRPSSVRPPTAIIAVLSAVSPRLSVLGFDYGRSRKDDGSAPRIVLNRQERRKTESDFVAQPPAHAKSSRGRRSSDQYN